MMPHASSTLARLWQRIDSALLVPACILSLLGLITMSSLRENDPFLTHQGIWIGLGVAMFFSMSLIDWRFLRRSSVVVSVYGAALMLLVLLVFVGQEIFGARSWFTFGAFALQPVELVKISLVVLLAKYFSRRHIEIRALRHIILSGIYVFIPFVLVALQPDFGSAVIIFCIWFGMVLVSGLSRVHLALLVVAGVSVFSVLWLFGFHDYQKQRILTFIHPMSDIHGAGWNAYQSTVAVGSGELVGKGIGYGTQSKLRYLPEYQTDFIFAAFAEEWGFLGVLLVLTLYAVLFLRLVQLAMRGASNFETLFMLGVLVWFATHVLLHTGINMGVLPVTGTTIPFMSYGGSHILAEFMALGIVSGMRVYGRAASRALGDVEFRRGYDR